MSRVVLFPFGPGAGLAHLGSCLAVGERLRERGHEVICAYGGTLPQLVEQAGFPLEPVPDIPSERTDAGLWFESVEELLAQAEADRALLERLRPDAVVVDLRIPSSLAAARAGVPALALMHFVRSTGFWREPHPWRKRGRQLKRAYRVPTVLPMKRRALANVLGNLAFAAEARRRYGLAPGRFIDGDAVAVTSTPLLDPAALPSTGGTSARSSGRRRTTRRRSSGAHGRSSTSHRAPRARRICSGAPYASWRARRSTSS